MTFSNAQVGSDVLALLQASLTEAQQLLQDAAVAVEFEALLETAFGPLFGREAGVALQQALAAGSYDWPEIELRSGLELQGALGAYGLTTGKIYLSEALVANVAAFGTTGAKERLTAVLLEELGHHLDAQLNAGRDAAGDEGAIFSALVRGEALDEARLTALRAEHDQGLLQLDGQSVAVEFASFVVTNANDSGAGSLRDAIAQANLAPGADTITFDPSLNEQTITLTSDELLITDDLTIDGDLDNNGTPDITVARDSAAAKFRIFNVNDGAVELDGLIITGGQTGDGDGESGGGIFTQRGLVLSNSIVSNNATGIGNFSRGGGIFSEGETVTLNNSIVSNNSTQGSNGGGGGIFSSTVILNNSTVSGNSTTGFNSGGGGIASSGGTLIVRNSTVSDNSTTGDRSGGGGINSYSSNLSIINSTVSGNFTQGEFSNGGGVVTGSLRELTVSNSTVSGNLTEGDDSRGGGIFSFFSNLAVSNSTVSDNSTAGTDSDGGGIFSEGDITINNSIVSGNVAQNSDGDEIRRSTGSTSTSNNVFGDSSKTNAEAFASFTPSATDITATSDGTNPTALNAIIAPLANNGGNTQTRALVAGSPAIDAGNNANVPSDAADQDNNGDTAEPSPFDQRGPGFVRIDNGTVDIGAVEFPATPVVSITAIDAEADENSGDTATYQVTRSGGDISQALTVELSLGLGADLTASDFTLSGGDIAVTGSIATITIPAGQTSVDITLTANDDAPAEAAEALTLTVDVTPDYDVDASLNDATATILANDTLVTNTNDSGEGSLRQAILNANDPAVADSNRVDFDSSLNGQTITLTSGQLTITDDLTIDGDLNDDGAPDITVMRDSNAADFRIFDVNDGDLTVDKTVVLNGLTITGGRVAGFGGDGGGIRSRENLTISNSTVSSNSTADGEGGGISSRDGDLNVTNSTVSGNSTAGYGSSGGGIASANGDLGVTNSTVSGNFTQGNGRYNAGGGIFSVFGDLSVVNSTVSGNFTEGTDADGGGIAFSEGGDFTLSNSIVSGNEAQNGDGDEIRLGFVGGFSSSNNVLGDSSKTDAEAFERFTPSATDITATSDGTNATALNAIIAPLANNGGGTQTHALVAGSPAINAGNNANIPTDAADQDSDGNTTEPSPFDQRGPGFVRINSGTVDAGAFEAQNAPPVITSLDAATVDENQTSAIDVDATDDAPGVSFSLTGGDDAALFNIDSTTGEVTFKTAPDFENPIDADGDNAYDVQVTATDAGGLTDVQDIAITVANVNEAPAIDSSATVTVLENQTTVLDVESSDPDGETENGGGLTYSLTGGPDQGAFTIDIDTGELRFVSAPDFENPADADGDNLYDVQVTVTDAEGLTDIQDIAVTVTDVLENGAPVITSAPTAIANENQTSAIDVDAIDDAPGVSFSLTGGDDAALFNIDSATGEVTFKAAPDFETPADAGGNNVYDIQVTATDAGGLTDVQDIAITVANVNEAPIATDDNFSTDEDGVLEIDAPGVLGNDSDIDGDAVTAAIATNAANGNVTLNPNGSFSYTPDANFNGTDSFTYTISDGALTDSATVTIEVNPVNDAPVGVADSYSTDAGQTLSILAAQGVLINDSDVDGDALSAALETDATNGSITLNPDGSFNYTPDANFSGSDSFTYRVSDGTVTSDPITVNITVDSQNEAPTIISPDHVTVHENQTSVIDVEATDDTNSEGNGLTYSLTGHIDDALFDINAHTGEVTFKTAPDFEHPNDHGRDNVYDIQVTVTDADSLSDVQDIAITVADVAENAAPTIISPDHVTVHENQTFAIDVEATDDVNSEGNGLSYSLTGHIDDALFDINAHTGEVSFKTAPDFEQPTDHGRNNTYDIQVTATDADGLSDVQNIAITVADVAESSGADPLMLYGTDADEMLVGGDGSDRISGNGGKDKLIGNGGNDTIWGGSQVDHIWGGDGNDTIFGNGDQDFIDSGSGFDRIWLGGQSDATVVLSEGEGYDWIANFQMGMTSLKGFSEFELDITDSAEGVRIVKGTDLLAIVPWKTKAMLKGAFVM